MGSILHKGQLTTWKDDRGFGFIKPNDGGREVFLHISALKRSGRRPKVGDIIVYERVTQPDGKVRAERALIQGGALCPLPTQQRSRKRDPIKTFIGRDPIKTFIGVGILIIVALFEAELSPSRSPSPTSSITKPECIVKGNISISTGNRLYHIPGMEDYESTIIDPSKGERWFCTEAEAIANGWRKAPR
ncbi:MAG TPA: cold shock domain-containing protein [Elainellaceae cyanobacterium]